MRITYGQKDHVFHSVVKKTFLPKQRENYKCVHFPCIGASTFSWSKRIETVLRITRYSNSYSQTEYRTYKKDHSLRHVGSKQENVYVQTICLLRINFVHSKLPQNIQSTT